MNELPITFSRGKRWLAKLSVTASLLISASAMANGGSGGGADVLYGQWPNVGNGYENLQQPDSSGIDTGNAASVLTNPIWQFDNSDVPGASPVLGGIVVADNVAYFADVGGSVYAVNLQTGAPIWRSGPPAGNPSVVGYSFREYAQFADGPLFATAPTLTSDRLYIASSNQFGAYPFVARMFCLKRSTGELLWSTLVAPVITNEGKTYQPNDLTGDPIAVDGLVIVGLGSAENYGGPLNTPSIKNHKARGQIVAFDRFTGAVKWRSFNTSDQNQFKPAFGGGSGAWSSPAIDLKRKLLFIGTGQNYEFPSSPRSDSLIAMDYRTGDVKWSIQMHANDVWDPFDDTYGEDWDVNTHPNLFSVFVPGKGHVDYVGVADKSGKYYLIRRDQDPTNPKIDSIIILDRGAQDGTVQSTPTIDDDADMLYISSDAILSQGVAPNTNGLRTAMTETAGYLGITALDLFSLVALQGLIDPIVRKVDLRAMLADPAHTQDAIVWSSEFENTGQSFGPLALINDEVLVHTTGLGNLRMINAADGSVIGETGLFIGFATGGQALIWGGATVVGDIVLVPALSLDFSGGVVAFKRP